MPAWRRPRIAAGLAGAALVAAGSLLVVSSGGWPGWGGPAPATAPRFVEQAAAAGIDHRYQGDYPYVVGGGVAVFDCDGDGRPELYLAGGSAPAAFYRNESPAGGPLRFRRLPDAVTDLDAVSGAYPLDVDGDGRTDLAVLRMGRDRLLRGLGECRFAPADAAWGFTPSDTWTAAFSATWEGAAAWPTLAFGHYVNEASHDPDRLCHDNELLRPGPEGGFARPLPLAPGWCALSMLFSDWSRTGRRDLRVSNDRHYYSDYSDGEEQLWRMAPGEPPRLYTHDEGWQTVRVFGMGIASHDLTGDGRPEIFLTSQGDNKLQSLAGGQAAQPRYEDIALRRGVTANRPYAGDVSLPSTAWHAEFQDVDNDGNMDLFVAKGNVEALPGYAARDPSNLLLGRPDGTFVERAPEAGLVDFARARGAALADLDLDGLLDLVVVTRREPVRLWHNVGSGDAGRPAPLGRWLALRLRQPAPNVDAIGAWVELRAGDRLQQREVTVGGGHAGGQLGWLHFGLGDAVAAEVRVQWPDGEEGPWLPLDAGRRYLIERGAPAAMPWSSP